MVSTERVKSEAHDVKGGAGIHCAQVVQNGRSILTWSIVKGDCDLAATGAAAANVLHCKEGGNEKLDRYRYRQHGAPNAGSHS